MPENGNDSISTYQKECDVVATSWRFFIGLRFIVAGFAVTIQSALLTLYIRVLEKTAVLVTLHPTAIPAIGIFIAVAIFIIEERNISLFRLMIQRGTELEFRLGVTDGHFSRLSSIWIVHPPGIKRIVTHTFGLRIIYLVTLTL